MLEFQNRFSIKGLYIFTAVIKWNWNEIWKTIKGDVSSFLLYLMGEGVFLKPEHRTPTLLKLTIFNFHHLGWLGAVILLKKMTSKIIQHHEARLLCQKKCTGFFAGMKLARDIFWPNRLLRISPSILTILAGFRAKEVSKCLAAQSIVGCTESQRWTWS